LISARRLKRKLGGLAPDHPSMLDALRKLRRLGVGRFCRPTSGFLERIELSEHPFGELPVALIFIVELGHTGLALRYGFRRLGQLTLREWLTFQQRLIHRFARAIPGDSVLQRIELCMLDLGQLPMALAFVVERGSARLVGRHVFQRLGQATLLDLVSELGLIGPFLPTPFGPAWFGTAPCRAQRDQEQHRNGAQRHALLFISVEAIDRLPTNVATISARTSLTCDTRSLHARDTSSEHRIPGLPEVSIRMCAGRAGPTCVARRG